MSDEKGNMEDYLVPDSQGIVRSVTLVVQAPKQYIELFKQAVVDTLLSDVFDHDLSEHDVPVFTTTYDRELGIVEITMENPDSSEEGVPA